MTQQTQSDSEIFRAAAKLDPDQRAGFLKSACGDDVDLRNEVESLLRAHEPNDSFLRSPAYAPTVSQSLSEQPGSTIGPYKLREQIGEGGFGVVYVAEQEKPVRRKVALKVIKPGMDTKDVIARFEAERQALALMDHPNVARVLDAGTTESGRPFFVMELVQGVTITEFCDRNRLAARQRVELFADICRAVQHAHQKGIIHRDLKPSNIMITLHDGKPVVKVIDFGVSKALSQQLTEKTVYTAYGQMIGTPSYMSPEQAEMSGLGIDTRSDIYSLGVLLYELLTGQTPLDANRLRASGYAEIMRIIREEEPQRPSMKVSTLGDKATIIAQARQTDPEHLRRDLSGELDWIVMKCLEKDRARRYETANGLARDIERYLHDEPVEACPPSTWYRLSKFARRHRSLIGTVAAFVIVLAASTAVSSWLAVRATQAEHNLQKTQNDLILANEQEKLARQNAEVLKEKAEQDSLRLTTATQLANEGVEFYFAENLASALAKFQEATEVENDLYAIYLYRRKLLIEIGLWDRAAADYAQSFQLMQRNHHHTCYEHALLQYYVENKSGYRKACQEFLRQYGDSGNIESRTNLLRACSLAPEPVLNKEALKFRAEAILSAGDKPWHRWAAAMAFLRSGETAKAIEICDQSVTSDVPPPGSIRRMFYAIKTLALHASGRAEEARESLNELEVAMNEWAQVMVDGPVGTMPFHWYDWLETYLLYREAKIQISGSPPVEDARLVTVRERAEELTEGDVHTFMESGREATQRGEWDAAAENYATAIDKMPLSFRPGPGISQYLIEMVQQTEVFERLAKRQPKFFGLWWNRGLMNARRLEWGKSSVDLEKTQEMIGDWVTKRPGGRLAEHLAAVRLLAGQETDYLAMRDHIVSNADRINDPWYANSYSRICSLRPSTESESACCLRLAQQAHAQNPDLSYHLYALGAAHYRAGHYEEAIKPLQESLKRYPNWGGRAQNHAMLAMAYHKLERTREARASLNRAKKAQERLEQFLSKEKFDGAGSIFINDWLAMQVLIPEAESLLPESDRE